MTQTGRDGSGQAREFILETVAPNGARTRFALGAHGNVVQKVDGTALLDAAVR